MKFKKGHEKIGGRKTGTKDKKTQQWHDLGEFITNEGAERYMALLINLKDDKFLDRFENLLEYFKPKLSRTEVKAEITDRIVVKRPTRE